jgi:hypothetical protein
MAEDQIYLDEPYLSIRWRGGQQILYAEWKGFATSAEFRAALSTGLRAIREHHVVGYVSDARKAKVFVPDDQRWAMTDWAPQAVAAGLKRMAMVTAETRLATSSGTSQNRSTNTACQCGRSNRLGRRRSGPRPG